jgi:hypothetical protein
MDPERNYIMANRAHTSAERDERSTIGERITVALIPTVHADLRRLQERTGLSKTDIVNRAITSYEFFDAQMQAGWDIIVRDRSTGETQLVRFL